MKKEDYAKYENTIDNIDWIEFHKAMRHYDYGMNLWIYEDGTIDVQTSGTYPGNNSSVVAIIKTWGSSGSDECYYEGWGTWDRENEEFTTDDGRVLTEMEAIDECIENGDWTEQIESWKEEIKRQITDDEEDERDRQEWEDENEYDENESKQRKIDRAAETREILYPNYE